MKKTVDSAARMAALFSGLRRAYGVYEVTHADGAKQVGKAATVQRPVTLALWHDHLAGKKGIGIVPITDESTCLFGAIDVDRYEGLDVAKVLSRIEKKGYPLLACRSKSGGLHLFIFLKEPEPAQAVKGALTMMAAGLGFNGSEVFPKQGKVLVERGDIGSWINMPYFNAAKTTRYALARDGGPLPLEAFLDLAEGSKTTTASLKKESSQGDLADGPPCLQHLVSGEVTEGMRNEVLLNVAKYLKKAVPDNWRQKLEEVNAKLISPPLPAAEVNAIIKGVSQKDYFYSCNKPPMKSYCDRGTCKSRKYGAGGESDFPVLTGLTKYDTVPPTWFVEVEEGGRVELTTEELQNQGRFQRRCMDCLNLMPACVKPEQWRTLVQALLEKLNVIAVPRDASSSGQLLDLLEAFCVSRVQAKTKEEMLLGKPWTDKGRHFFRLADFLAFLERHRFRDFKVHKVSQLVKDHGGCHDFIRLDGKGMNVWSVPEFKKTRGRPLPTPDMGGEKPI